MDHASGLSVFLHLRVTSEDRERVARLASRVRSSRRAAIARAALRLGLDLVEKNPGVLIGAEGGETS